MIKISIHQGWMTTTKVSDICQLPPSWWSTFKYFNVLTWPLRSTPSTLFLTSVNNFYESILFKDLNRIIFLIMKYLSIKLKKNGLAAPEKSKGTSNKWVNDNRPKRSLVECQMFSSLTSVLGKLFILFCENNISKH